MLVRQAEIPEWLTQIAFEIEEDWNKDEEFLYSNEYAPILQLVKKQACDDSPYESQKQYR